MPTNLQCPTCQSIVKTQNDFQERCPRCGTFLEAGSPTEHLDGERVCSRMNSGSTNPKPDNPPILDNADQSTAFAHGETISHRHLDSVSKHSSAKLPTRLVKQTSNDTGFQTEYRLTSIIGEGNMGRVWLAEQTSLGREIALKYPKRDASTDTNLIDGMFVSEVQVTGKLNHPNIISIYELGRDEFGSPFYTMKYVRGKSWLQLLKAQSLEQKIEVLLKVCDAIAFAHANGHLHRDIKPENVMVGEFGEVVVMDWGIAIKNPADNDDHSECQERALAGTPAYMAPEMASGIYTDLGVHSDIYLLGAVLYQMIEGIPPHPQATDLVDALEKIRLNQIVDPIQSGELISIANKALATDPKDRFATVKEFQEAIRAYQSHVESIRLTDQGTRYLAQAIEESSPDLYSQSRFAFLEALRIWTGNQSATDALRKAKIAHAKYCLSQGDYTNGLSLLDGNDDEQIALIRNIRRKIKQREKRESRSRIWRLLALSMSSLVFFLTIGFLVAMVFWNFDTIESKNDIERERNNAFDQQRSAQKSAMEALKNGYRARQEAMRAEKSSYIANIRLANEQIGRNEFNDANETLGSINHDRHIEYWMLSKLREQSQENTFKVEGAAMSSVESVSLIAPGAVGFLAICDDAIYATEDVDPALGQGKAVRRAKIFERTDPSTVIITSAISASGEFLAVVLRRSGTGVSKNLLLSVHRRVGSDETPEKHFPTFANEHTESIELMTESCKNIVFSKDSNWILVSGSDSKAQVIACTWQSGNEVPERCTDLPCLKGDFVYHAVFSNDSRYIATGCGDGIVRIWQFNRNRWEYFGRFDDHEGPVYSVAFTPDGEKVISGGLDRRLLIRKLSDAPLSKKRVEETVKRQAVEQRNAFSYIRNDDLDSHDGSILSIAVGSFEHRLDGSSESKPGLFIATGSNDQTIRVWKVSNDALELIKVLRGHTHPVDACQFRVNKFELLSVASGEFRFWDILKYNFPTQLQGLREDRFSDSFLLRNPGAIRSVATSSDGRWVAAGFSDASVIAWDFSTPNASANVLRPEGHAFESKSAVWFGGGKQLITSGGDDTTCIWDRERMVQSEVLRATGARGVVAVSQWTEDEPQVFVTGSSQAGSLGSIWVESQSAFVRVPVPSAIPPTDSNGDLDRSTSDATCVAISEDATQVAIGDDQGDLHFFTFNRTTLAIEHKHTWSLSNSGLVDVFFVDGDKSVLVATEDGIIQKRGFNSEKVEFDIHVPPNVTSMTVSTGSSKFFLGFSEVRSDDDLLIACYDHNDPTYVEQTNRGNLSRVVQSNEILKIIDLEFNHSDGSIVGILDSNDANKGLSDIAQKLIRLTKKQASYDHELIGLKLPYAANGLLTNLSDTSNTIIVVGGSGGRLVNLDGDKNEDESDFSKGIFEMSTELASLSISESHRDSDRSIEVRNMAAGLDDGRFRIWESMGDRWIPFQSVTLDSEDSVYLCFNPVVPNELIVFGQKAGMQVYQKISNRYRLIKSVIDQQDFEKMIPSGEINKVCISKDGLAFAIASTQETILYTRDTTEEKSVWKCRLLFPGEPCFDLCFSSDSKVLYVSRADRIDQFLMSNLSDPNYKPQTREVSAEKFLVSPDGKRLVHFERKLIRISDWYEATSKPIELLQFEDHKDRVTDIKFLYNEYPLETGVCQCALITADSSGKIFLKWFTPEISREPQGMPTDALGHEAVTISDPDETKADFSGNSETIQKPLRPFENFSLVDPMQQLTWESYSISPNGASDQPFLVQRSREIEDGIRLYEYSHSCLSTIQSEPRGGSKDLTKSGFQTRVIDYMTSLMRPIFDDSNTRNETKPKGLVIGETVKLTLQLTPSRSAQLQLRQEEVSNMQKEVTIRIFCQERENSSTAKQPDP